MQQQSSALFAKNIPISVYFCRRWIVRRTTHQREKIKGTASGTENAGRTRPGSRWTASTTGLPRSCPTRARLSWPSTARTCWSTRATGSTPVAMPTTWSASTSAYNWRPTSWAGVPLAWTTSPSKSAPCPARLTSQNSWKSSPPKAKPTVRNFISISAAYKFLKPFF